MVVQVDVAAAAVVGSVLFRSKKQEFILPLAVIELIAPYSYDLLIPLPRTQPFDGAQGERGDVNLIAII